MSKAASIFVRLERKIASDERGGIEHRYEFGAELIKARGARQRLPKGYLADRAAEMERAGLPVLSEQEMYRRMRFAEVYPTKAHRHHVVMLKGSWHAIVNDNFPEVPVDESPSDADGVDDLTDVLPDPADWEQPSLIPGLKPEIKVNGKKLALTAALVADGEAYEEMCISMHEGFGKTVDQVRQSMHYARLAP